MSWYKFSLMTYFVVPIIDRLCSKNRDLLFQECFFLAPKIDIHFKNAFISCCFDGSHFVCFVFNVF